MPYTWTDDHSELHLWPHQSLPPDGFVIFMGATSLLITVPLVPLFGTVLLWGLLPFLALAVAGLWFALNRSRHKAQVIEVLTLDDIDAHLIRRNPDGREQEWQCNRHWARAELHEKDGPVPAYVTLIGAGREVEIGAFLSEDERRALYDDLMAWLRP